MKELHIRQSRFEISVTWALVLLAMSPGLFSGLTSSFSWFHMLFIAALAALLLEIARRVHRLLGTFLFGLMTTFFLVEITCYQVTGLHLNAFTLSLLFERDALTNIGISLGLPGILVLAFGASLYLALKRRQPPHRFRLRWLGALALLMFGLSQLIYGLLYFYAVPGTLETQRKLALFHTPHPYHIGKLFSPVLGPHENHSFALTTSDTATTPGDTVELTLQRKPDILLIIMDSLRSKDIIRDPALAPTLMNMGSRGQLLAAQYSVSNCTHFSMFTMMTGLLPNHYGAARLNAEPLGLTPILAQSGYQVSSAEALSLNWYDIAQLLLTPATRYIAETGTMRERDRFVTERTVEFLRPQGQSPRFHIAYYNAVHFPYGDDLPITGGKGGTLAGYETAIKDMDHELALLMPYIEAQVKSGELLAIITADHGESVAGDGIVGHSSALTNEQMIVPLGVMGGRKNDLPISQTGLYSYILGELGVSVPWQSNPIILSNCDKEVPRGFAVIDGDSRTDFIYEDGFLSPTPSPDGKMPPKAEQLRAAKSLLKALTERP